MASSPIIRPAIEADLPSLVQLDYSYDPHRLLHFTRQGEPPQHTFRFQWRTQSAPRRPGYQYEIDHLRRGGLERAPLFDVAEVEGQVVGLVIVLTHGSGNTGEVTDLAIHLPFRRRGIGAALMDQALGFARMQNLRLLWVEPQNDNADAIEFYLRLGFRLSGFNDRMYSNRDDELQQITLFMTKDLP